MSSSLAWAAPKKEADGGEKLAEGIYIYNRKKRPVDETKLLLGRGDVRLYPDEIKRLRGCIDNLNSSNRTLEDARSEDPEEVEYSLALRENVEIIAGMEKQIADLEAELIAKGFRNLVEPKEKCTQHLLSMADDDDEEEEVKAAAAATAAATAGKAEGEEGGAAVAAVAEEGAAAKEEEKEEEEPEQVFL
eukprot:Rhum_TRINITY_DN14297_c11_g3::Rhum_TRINITY_DN14297_c11_g3_i1::g.78718::m.78718